MNRSLLRLAPLAALLLLSLLLALGLFKSKPSDAPDSRLVGEQVAPFTVAALGGTGAPFSPKLWQGRVAVLNVFASWCGPCAAEHETLMNLAKTQKVAIYGLAWKDKPDNISAFLNARGNPYQAIGIDAEGKATIPLALTGVPETFVIDRGGNIRYHLDTAVTPEILSTVILPLVAQLNSQPDATRSPSPAPR